MTIAEQGPALEPDPSRVFTHFDLSEQLGLLQGCAPDGRPRRRVGLTALARETGIPRSTLHTYLSGHTLPDADALDTIVLALGCGPAEARAWASARQRVGEANRGSDSRSRSASWSRFARTVADVNAMLDRPTDRWFQLSVRTVQSEVVTVGPTGRIEQVEMQQTLRAVEDGVDRWALMLPRGTSAPDPRLLRVTDLHNGIAGDHRWLEGPGFVVFEVLFGQPLMAGETHQLGLRVDYSDARAADTESSARCVDVLRGFPRQAPTYALEVRFESADDPRDLRQVHVHSPEAPENRICDLRLNPWRTVSVAVDRPVAGLHGIRWSW